MPCYHIKDKSATEVALFVQYPLRKNSLALGRLWQDKPYKLSHTFTTHIHCSVPEQSLGMVLPQSRLAGLVCTVVHVQDFGDWLLQKTDRPLSSSRVSYPSVQFQYFTLCCMCGIKFHWYTCIQLGWALYSQPYYCTHILFPFF